MATIGWATDVMRYKVVTGDAPWMSRICQVRQRMKYLEWGSHLRTDGDLTEFFPTDPAAASLRHRAAQIQPYQSMNQWINESINQWINESMNQSINESINQWINQSINQWINESMNQSINQSMNQLINESINQSINESINQSINESFESWCVFFWDTV